jgi:hypothetical protein
VNPVDKPKTPSRIPHRPVNASRPSCRALPVEGVAQSNSQGNEGVENGGAAPATGRNRVAASFTAIVPSDKDVIVLSEGFRYKITRSSGDLLSGGLT